MHKSLLLLLKILALSSCHKSDRPLQNMDFSNGDWLLVNIDYSDSKKKIRFIDDERTLKANKNGLWLTPFSDCQYTTCDGFLSLYKNGKLVAEKGYLSKSTLYESKALQKVYKNGIELTINPTSKASFVHLWDSIKKSNSYPTIYHTQPDNKDIILIYQAE